MQAANPVVRIMYPETSRAGPTNTGAAPLPRSTLDAVCRRVLVLISPLLTSCVWFLRKSWSSRDHASSARDSEAATPGNLDGSHETDINAGRCSRFDDNYLCSKESSSCLSSTNIFKSQTLAVRFPSAASARQLSYDSIYLHLFSLPPSGL